MPSHRQLLLLVRLANAWRRVTTPWRRRRGLRDLGLSGQLDTAIRDGNADAVARLLETGAPLYSCTLDHESYHTPLELARRYANPAVVSVLERARAIASDTRPGHGTTSIKGTAMSMWQAAVMDNLFYDHSKPDFGDECFVRFEGELIYVKYDVDGEPQQWRGEELAPGHYDLKLMEGSGHASLHRFPNANVLVGEWVEDGEKGTWRVRLAD